MNCLSILVRSALLLGLLLCAGGLRAEEPLELVRDGVSAYRICIPDTASEQAVAAAETLRNYLREISGADLPIIRSTEHPGKRIVFEVGCSVDHDLITATLGSDGFRLRTIHSYLFFTAHTDRGLQNAVYSFLESYLGCRKYSPTVEYIPHTRDIIIAPMNVTQIPRLAFRLQHFEDSAYSAWHKLSSLDDWGLFVHTFKTLVPPEKYFQDHPEYFSENNGVRTPNGQLCLTNPEVFRIVVEELRRRIRENPRARYWSVSQNDTYLPCQCEYCRAFDCAEGSHSGSLVGFANLVADEFPGKVISTLAYQYSRAAPVRIRPAPNVNIMLCTIELNRSRPIALDPSSASFVKDLKDWSRLTDNIFLWDYVIQFRSLLAPFPNLHVLQPNLQFFVENGITQVYEQGTATLSGEFAELRAYLISKLLWDPYLNLDSVMNDFLHGFYGAAAPFVRKYIDTMHAALAGSGEDLSIYGYPYPSENGFLAAAMIDEYERIFDRAETAVAGDEAVRQRVQTARLPVQYARLEQARMLGFGDRGFFVHGADGAVTARQELIALLETFVERCRRAGVIRLWEHGVSPDEYLASSRRFIESAVTPHLAAGRPVALSPAASPKYHDGAASALTNGLKGWNDYHFHWLGFEGTDMDAVIDLGAATPISRIETDFLQDILSWVFMPTEVEFLLSDDGSRYRSVGKVVDSIPADGEGPIVAPYNVQFAPTPARYVRVKATGLKTCPSWHKGFGGQAWIFIDEIRVH